MKQRSYALTAIIVVLCLAISLISIAVLKYKIPFSWDVWFHIRMGDAFKEGFVWWDWGSFGPTGRPNLYPPAFHIFLALVSYLGSTSAQNVARYLPLFLFPATIFLIYWLVSLLYDRKIAILSSIIFATIPVSVDRGVISSSQSFAILLMLLTFIFFYKSLENRNYIVLAGLAGAGVVLSHGLTLIVLAIELAMFAFAVYIMQTKGVENKGNNALWLLVIFAIIAAIIPSYWLYYLFNHGVYSRIPESAAISLRDYPDKLGVLPLALSFIGVGITLSRRNKGDYLVLSWLIITFLLSTSIFWVLPSRFVEFMAFPVAILAAMGVRRLLSSNRMVLAFGIFGLILVSLSAPFDYLSSISPLVYENEENAFDWLETCTVVDGQIMTGWFFAPVGAAISHKVPVKGAYYSGSFHYTERTNDTNDFYHGDLKILEKYNVRIIYVGRKERYDYEEVGNLDFSDNFNKLYSNNMSAFYGYVEEGH